ncbi:MAG: LIC12162 family protein [Mariprofundaceae bacterium]|nr:LIC12162 family protein [Mariprofundaceae bacterium]
MILEKRHLITTANECSWKFDRPVLFLGEWCRLYDRKQVWEGMDGIVAEPYGLEDGQKEHDIAYIQSLSMQLLVELTDALNAVHSTSHGTRYWEIVLGHWLQRYVAVIFNRYFTLDQALNNYDVPGSTVFDSKAYSLATADSMGFIWACNDDVWNHVLYSKILNYWGNIEVEFDDECIRGLHGFVLAEKSCFAPRAGGRQLILNAIHKITQIFSREQDAFIVNSFLPMREEIKLQLSFLQCPQLWRSPKLQVVSPDMGKRRSFGIDTKSHQGFERFVRLLLCEVIPTCYLEGYSQMVQQMEQLSWPSKPKFIFTSNIFDTDELFKSWVGSRVEEGIPYFVGQHGNNYGTHLYFGNKLWPEFTTSDNFFTWGWTNGISKNIPAFVYKVVGQKYQSKESEGGLLLIELHPPYRIVPEDSDFEFGIYQEEQFRFVEALPDDITQKLTVRLHSGYREFRWFDEQRWKDRSPFTIIETGLVPIQQLIAKSRLVIYSYDSTGVIESLALNVPMMCFWHGGLDHLLPSAKPYYELLRSANILADTPEQAAEFVALHWDNINEWWESPKVQGARKTFCDQYARVEKKPIRTLRKLLINYANQGNRI